VDALQEFSVQQNAYSAEYHGSGATFNVTTKSGGNVYHGSVFEFMRNDAFDSKNFFAVNKEKLERNLFGSTLGGPVLIPGMYDGRNKTFFFASYEGHRRQQGVVNVANVPSAAQRQGDFRGLAPIFDPLTTANVGDVNTRTQFANNMIPQDRISPQARFFMQYIPLPNGPNNTYVSNPITEFSANQVTLRLDQEINQHHRLFARYSDHRNVEDREGWDARRDEARGAGVQRRGLVDLEFRQLAGARSPLQPHVWRVSIHGVLSRAGRRPGAGSGGRERARGHAGSVDCQPAGVQLLRIQRVLRERRRRPPEVAGPRRIRADRQPDVDQGQAHCEGRRTDVSPQHPVHRRAQS
jgi:hypothetical protein